MKLSGANSRLVALPVKFVLDLAANLACYDATMKTTFAIYAITLAMGSVLFAQSKPTPLAKIYVGPEGLAHVVDDTGKDTAIHKEKNQVAVSAPKLSDDRQTAGWLIEQENCCTSYTIPTSLAIYRAGKKRL